MTNAQLERRTRKVPATFLMPRTRNSSAENIKLQKELDMYRTNWMRRCLFSDLRVNVCVVDRPTGATANYFIEIGKILSGSGKIEEEEEKGEKLDKHLFDIANEWIGSQSVRARNRCD